MNYLLQKFWSQEKACTEPAFVFKMRRKRKKEEEKEREREKRKKKHRLISNQSSVDGPDSV